MKVFGPTRFQRLNEAAAIVFLGVATCLVLSLASYHPQDLSWDTVGGTAKPMNIIGPVGAFVSDLLLQAFGGGAFLLPIFLLLVAGRWVRSRPIGSPVSRLAGSIMLLSGLCAIASLGPSWPPFRGVVPAGGMLGTVLADILTAQLNPTGAVIVTGVILVLSLYLLSDFTLMQLPEWSIDARGVMQRWSARREAQKNQKMFPTGPAPRREPEPATGWAEPGPAAPVQYEAPHHSEAPHYAESEHEYTPDVPVHIYDERSYASSEPEPVEEDHAPWEEPAPASVPAPSATKRSKYVEPEPEEEELDIPIRALEPVETRSAAPPPPPRRYEDFEVPSTDLLNEPPGRNAFDTQELKEIAGAIKSKFEEFNVLGTVTQINPGPVVTTFEFKPEAGIKLSRITTLSEDLCLGLQAESVLIERIPGKPTVGIEVPNSKREVISLRQILESDEFRQSPSPLTIPLGKDINGRIKVASMETMPHLLIAGSTGAGKSVMLNSMIMSILYKSTPNEVRMIMVDPKRVELGIYEGIPHLLTPVITDPKKATNALRNAVLEMERRLKLLASQGVRNIEQFNRKVREVAPQKLVDETTGQELDSLPMILILIDELADLMMLERANVEEAVTRLAQMARAVGMHLVLATQRPSVDVITGLIKANFPSRISFRVATRVDSRTILDSMGAEHLLGKGDMLFLPPGSSRLQRVHGAFVTEAETNRVVEFWKEQARPEYDQSFLAAPPGEEEKAGEEFDGEQDPAYQDAVRIVLEMGKASTSTLQRRLRLGYGRAARILDMMQRDGIIGPPDGSRPREVLKRPDWLDETQEQYR